MCPPKKELILFDVLKLDEKALVWFHVNASIMLAAETVSVIHVTVAIKVWDFYYYMKL